MLAGVIIKFVNREIYIALHYSVFIVVYVDHNKRIMRERILPGAEYGKQDNKREIFGGNYSMKSTVSFEITLRHEWKEIKSTNPLIRMLNHRKNKKKKKRRTCNWNYRAFQVALMETANFLHDDYKRIYTIVGD